MLGGIPVEWLVQGGATSGLMVGVLLIGLGLLVPRRTLRDVQKVADTWRLAYEAERERNAVLVSQSLMTAIEVGKTGVAMIDGIKQAAANRPSVTP